MVYGFIGLGSMATAIIGGMAFCGSFAEDVICGFNRSEEKTLALSEKYGLVPKASAAEVAGESNVLLLCVKPQVLPEVLPEVKQALRPGTLVISIAAGKTLDYFAETLGENVPVVRIMPNLNAAVQAAVSGMAVNENVTEREKAAARQIFEQVGTVMEIPESRFSAFTAIAGSSPAFTCMYIDALANAAAKAGMPKAQALQAAAAAVLGSAKLLLETGEHPSAVADRVCSPGGTTIEGVLSLEKDGFAENVSRAVEAVIEKDRRLGAK